MKFEFVHSVENVEKHNVPFTLLIHRTELLSARNNSPLACRSELKALAEMYGGYFGARADWPEEEADHAARLLELEPECQALALSIQQMPGTSPRVVYDAE